MKGVFHLSLLLLHVYLSHCCLQERPIAFCQTIPEDLEPGVLTLLLALSDVGVINSSVLHNANFSSVTKLTIRNAGVTTIAQGAFSSFQNLTSLILDQNLLTHIDPQWLGNPGVLGKLDLAGNRINGLTDSSLRGLRGLRRLSLKKNRIRTISPHAFTDLTRLADLDLSGNRLTGIPLQVFRSLESTRMSLEGNPWDCSCAALDFIDFIKGEPSYEMLENHPDWKPSLRLGHSDVQATDEARFQRLKRRSVRRASHLQGRTASSPLCVQDQAPPPHPSADQPLPPPPPQPHQDRPLPPPALDHKDHCCAFCKPRQDVINSLLEENRQLKEQLERYRLNENFLKAEDEKVKHYTGLSDFLVFQVLL